MNFCHCCESHLGFYFGSNIENDIWRKYFCRLCIPYVKDHKENFKEIIEEIQNELLFI